MSPDLEYLLAGVLLVDVSGDPLGEFSQVCECVPVVLHVCENAPVRFRGLVIGAISRGPMDLFKPIIRHCFLTAPELNCAARSV
jgi:hypothetical protein